MSGGLYSMQSREFDKTLEYGESFEKKAVKDIKRLMGEDLVRSIQKINYEDNPQKQHDGIDIEMEESVKNFVLLSCNLSLLTEDGI